MCLVLITVSKADPKAVRIGYSVAVVSGRNRYSGVYYGVYYGSQRGYAIGQRVRATGSFDGVVTGVRYKRGFHVWRTLKDARAYAAEFQRSPYETAAYKIAIVKVRVEHRLATGRQFRDGPICDVWLYRTILNEVYTRRMQK